MKIIASSAIAAGIATKTPDNAPNNTHGIANKT
jgi:hypothetical protein